MLIPKLKLLLKMNKLIIRNPVIAAKTNSPIKTASVTKIHGIQRSKMRTLCGEKNSFSRLFTANLALFFENTSSQETNLKKKLRHKLLKGALVNNTEITKNTQ